MADTATTTTGNCARCGNHGNLLARGLDSYCYHLSRRDGTIADYGRRNRRLTETLEDVEFFTAGGMPHNEIAKRLGMTPKALHQELARARRQGLTTDPDQVSTDTARSLSSGGGS